MSKSRTTLKQGAIAGLIGAAAVAIWFFIYDTISGRPFYMPGMLGSALFLRARSVEAVVVSPGVIVGYTIVHGLAFLIAGIVATALVRLAESEPGALIGLVLLFVTLQVFVIGLIAIVAEWLLTITPWWTFVVANLLAAVCMGVYLWKTHPGLGAQLKSR